MGDPRIGEVRLNREKPDIQYVCIGRMEGVGWFFYMNCEKNNVCMNISPHVMVHVDTDMILRYSLWRDDWSTNNASKAVVNENLFMNEPWFIPFLMEFWSELPEELQVALARIVLV